MDWFYFIHTHVYGVYMQNSDVSLVNIKKDGL